MDTFEKVVSLAKRRGFIYPGSDIYGGLAGFYDWGHLGVKLKWNIEWAWWRDTVQLRDDVVGIDAAVIMNPKAWEASGHVSGFADELVECKKCHGRFRSNEIGISKFEFLISNETICPTCGAKGNFTEPKQFNLMFKTHVGPAEDSSSVAYLRPETAGGIFVNFKNVLDTNRVKIPFGIAQIGKVFRNEINPRDFVFRTREFKQMELEYFVKPGEDGKYFDEWVERRFKWYESIGLKHIRKREQKKEERAHYSKATTDIEYKFPMSAEGGSPPKADAPLEHASGGECSKLTFWISIIGILLFVSCFGFRASCFELTKFLNSYLRILVTAPAPTVFPPSLIANLCFSSSATGAMSFTEMDTVSPGITISTPCGSVTSPVTSVVRM